MFLTFDLLLLFICSICKAWNCINQYERPFAFLCRFAANNHCHLLRSLKDCRPNVIYIFNINIQVHIRSAINSSLITMLILEEGNAGNPLCDDWYEHQNQTAQVWMKLWHFCIPVLKILVLMLTNAQNYLCLKLAGFLFDISVALTFLQFYNQFFSIQHF